MTGRDAVMDRIARAQRLGGVHAWEADGLLCALYDEAPSDLTLMSSQYRTAFWQGFRDGREMLEVYGTVAA